MNKLLLGKFIYCNWHKGPHKKQCANPTQCFCWCHKDNQLTTNKIKQEIEYHTNRINALREELDKREG